MEALKLLHEPDRRHDYTLAVRVPLSEDAGYVGRIAIEQDAEDIVQAVSEYDSHVAILDLVQLMLAEFPGRRHLQQHQHLMFATLKAKVDEALVRHHEYLEYLETKC